MSDFKSIETTVNPQQIDASSSTQKVALGHIIRAKDWASTAYGVGEFIYLKGVASTVVGSVVHYNADDFSTTLAVADGKGPIAVAMSACVANEFGWYQIQGKGAAKVKAGFADDGDCYLTSTAGSVDDANVAGDWVYGMKGASAIDTPSTGLAEVELSRPMSNDGADD